MNFCFVLFLFPVSTSTKSSCTAAGMKCLADPQMTFPQKWRTGGRSSWVNPCSERRVCWYAVPPPTRACLQTTPPPTPPTCRSTCPAVSCTSQRTDPHAGQSPPDSQLSDMITTKLHSYTISTKKAQAPFSDSWTMSQSLLISTITFQPSSSLVISPGIFPFKTQL